MPGTRGTQQKGRRLPDKRPNILFITTDQQRGDALSINGADPLATPNLDFLASSGTNFVRAYAECPSCIPARRTMMSGQAPATHGMVGYYGKVGWDLEHSLPGELKRAGYQTQLVGKLHLYPNRKRYGFDHLILANSQRDDNDYGEWLGEQDAAIVDAGVAHGISPNSWTGRPTHLNERFTHTTWCVNEALKFIDRRDPDDPFFLWVSFVDSHPPLTPPAVYWERYAALDLPEPYVGDWAPQLDEPPLGLDPEASVMRLRADDLQRCRAGYYGLINHVDDQVARLLKVIRERGQLDDTLVLFTSDHGEMLGDHNLFRKTWPYEASIRVPFLARAPEWMETEASQVIDLPIGLQDVMPTFLDAAGVPIPESIDGRSVLPVMRGETPAWRDYLHGEHTALFEPDQGNQWVTDGHQKFIWYTQTGREQFFDLDADPREMHDAVNDAGERERVDFWRRRLIDELRGRPEGFVDGDRLVPGRTEFRPEQLRPELNRVDTA